MKTPTPASKDNVMMSTLLITGLLMVFAVPALNAQQHRVDQAVNSFDVTTTQAACAAAFAACPRAVDAVWGCGGLHTGARSGDGVCDLP